ncbi:MAG: sigma-54-dependent Fis family transcriptional regulator [Bryobacterales bacterium]|nr:sigma-54-dependent Fis family transcriptional regulator [Bryobacterales bacterium]
MESILVIDDDPGFRRLLETILRGESYEVESGGSVADAVRLGARRQYHLVLSDLKLPDGDGLEVLRWFAEQQPQTPVIMITAFGTVSSAVEAMKLGAVDYLGKPLSSPEELRLLVRRALEGRQIACERDLLREEEDARLQCGSLVARDPKMTRVLELAGKVAATNATVLITGESGTGKEVLARCIHNNSPRANRVFVPVNCAALSPSLIESELFGHEKGAFTGAVAQHLGRFERAHGGTLFLDEIGELDGNLQSKLLRVLQERTFERVGGARQIQVDVRIIAATNRDLKRQVAEGKFRDDLYYRLTTFPIEIPALRERPADIAALARLFLGRAARNLGKPAPELSPEALKVLISYGWPGNVRELENLMERMTILCDRVVKADDLPITRQEASRPVSWHEIERQAIEEALRMNNGNRTLAAKQLGISLRTLQYRLKEYEQEKAG